MAILSLFIRFCGQCGFHLNVGMDMEESSTESQDSVCGAQLKQAVEEAIRLIKEADQAGDSVLDELLLDAVATKDSDGYAEAVRLYKEAFKACAHVLELDRYAFQSAWFRSFYKRNYDALMIASMYENVINDVDNVRQFLDEVGVEQSSQVGEFLLQVSPDSLDRAKGVLIIFLDPIVDELAETWKWSQDFLKLCRTILSPRLA